MGKSTPGAGDVPIMLAGDECVMTPSLEACIQISKLAGNSLQQAVARIMDRLDFEFICEVVAIGIGATSPHLKKQVAEKIYRQGVISVAADCVLFVRTVMNGGTRPDDDKVVAGLDLIDRLQRCLDPEMTEEAAQLEALRAKLYTQLLGEGDDRVEAPLAESESPSGSTIAA
jgi:hypothetical protein